MTDILCDSAERRRVGGRAAKDQKKGSVMSLCKFAHLETPFDSISTVSLLDKESISSSNLDLVIFVHGSELICVGSQLL